MREEVQYVPDCNGLVEVTRGDELFYVEGLEVFLGKRVQLPQEFVAGLENWVKVPRDHVPGALLSLRTLTVPGDDRLNAYSDQSGEQSGRGTQG